ncbi:MAG TPA: hypothetical protein VFJ82_23535 [Longimicrobium sp.]|nr:hypothetical protein [Longimicrobium sp.]
MSRHTIRGKINPVDPRLPVSRDGWIGPDLSPSVGPVLARWTYTPAEWGAYTGDRYVDGGASWLVGVGLALLAFWFAVKNVTRPVLALLVAAVFAAGVIGTRVSVARTRRRNLAIARPTVVIGVNGVIAPGQHPLVCDDTLRVTRVTYLALQEHPELAITVSHPGRGGKKEFTMNVPIPRGHEDEAVELVDRFMEGRWYDHEITVGTT